MKTPLFLILLPLLTLLSGCGQTGPLYLPDEPPPIHVEK
ncbi:MAG: LPS translocon maturation chaperone LptM [Gammaproteobacteria bacterium]